MLNGIRCDKLSTEVTTVRVHPDKYEKDFDAVITFLIQYVNTSVKVASVTHIRPAKRQKTSATHGTFKGKIKLKKYYREEYDHMSTAPQLHAPEKDLTHIG